MPTDGNDDPAGAVYRSATSVDLWLSSRASRAFRATRTAGTDRETRTAWPAWASRTARRPRSPSDADDHRHNDDDSTLDIFSECNNTFRRTAFCCCNDLHNHIYARAVYASSLSHNFPARASNIHRDRFGSGAQLVVEFLTNHGWCLVGSLVIPFGFGFGFFICTLKSGNGRFLSCSGLY